MIVTPKQKMRYFMSPTRAGELRNAVIGVSKADNVTQQSDNATLQASDAAMQASNAAMETSGLTMRSYNPPNRDCMTALATSKRAKEACHSSPLGNFTPLPIGYPVEGLEWNLKRISGLRISGRS